MLTARQTEVLRLVAAGHTNREIAGALRLSTRTVDMHMRHVLARMQCRTRTEAVARGLALGVIGNPSHNHKEAPDGR